MEWGAGGARKGKGNEGGDSDGQIWRMGKKRFGNDWNEEYDYLTLIWVSYEMEIWSWKKREGMEMLQDRYLVC